MVSDSEMAYISEPQSNDVVPYHSSFSGRVKHRKPNQGKQKVDIAKLQRNDMGVWRKGLGRGLRDLFSDKVLSIEGGTKPARDAERGSEIPVSGSK